MKQKTLWSIIGLAIAIALLIGWFKNPASDSNIISRNGLHWHPELTIYIDGEKQELPANIGLSGIHQPMHTHDEDAAQGVVHFEFSGLVKSDDLLLKNFFTIWNKDITSAFGTLDRMTVNGQDNTTYGNYQVQEKDKIELYYTTSSAETNQASTTPSLEES